MISREVIDATALTTGAFTLGGAAVGVAGVTANQVVHSRQERAARSEARQEQRDDRRRQVLIDFEEALTVYVRTVWRIHYADFVAATASGVWGRLPRTPEVDLELSECSRRARQLSEWIVDDALRERFWGAGPERIRRIETAGLRGCGPEIRGEDEHIVQGYRR